MNKCCECANEEICKERRGSHRYCFKPKEKTKEERKRIVKTMTDRDKLIELIRQGKDMTPCEKDNDYRCEGIKCADCESKSIADYLLLANGVIVPPCKVGDKVYKITRNKVKECEVVFIGISADEKCSYFNFVENYADGTFYKSHSMVFDVIGKTVFLTKEEAEKALERSNGNA